MMLDNNTPLGEIPFAAFDIETTGLNPLTDKILEMAVVTFRRGEIQETIDSLINPGIVIPETVKNIHGISDEMVIDMPALAELIDDFLVPLGNSVVVAHNVSFDLSFFTEAAKAHGREPLTTAVVDSCELARQLFPNLTSYKLTSLVEKFGLPCDQSHRALSDAKSCFALFCKCVETLPKKWDTAWEEFRSLFTGIMQADLDELILPEKLIPVKEALIKRRRIRLSYRDAKGGLTKREVTPMGFASDHNHPVLIGYCHLRQSKRTFRLDRILEIEIS